VDLTFLPVGHREAFRTVSESQQNDAVAAASAAGSLDQSNELALRQKAHDAIMAGRLPVRSPTAVWGGPGTGRGCAVCAEVISPEGLGFELEFRADHAVEVELHDVHLWCFAAWEHECQRFLPAARDDGTIPGRERDGTHSREPG
jgi:hypothetical protein